MCEVRETDESEARTSESDRIVSDCLTVEH